MPLSPTEQAFEQQMRNVPIKNLTPEQKHTDMEAIRQALDTRKHRQRTRRRYVITALCAACAVVLTAGVVKVAPTLHMGAEPHKLPAELRPVSPDSISKEAVSLWKNGTAMHGFITYNNYYYIATDQLVKRESELGQQIGTIKRIRGDDGGQPIENLESMFFGPDGAIFSLQGIDPNDKIAYQIYKNGQEGSSFLIFQRDTPLGQRNLKTYTAEKGDAENVEKALQNISQSFPDFYELKGHESQAHQVIFEPRNGPGAFVSYVYQFKFVDIYEYKKGMEDSKDTDLPDATIYRGTAPAPRTFTQNGIHWSMYTDDLLRGEQGDYYYVVRPHGHSFEEIRGLLQDFKPH